MNNLFDNPSHSILLCAALEYLAPTQIFQLRRLCKNSYHSIDQLCVSSIAFCNRNLINNYLPEEEALTWRHLKRDTLRSLNWVKLGSVYAAALLVACDFHTFFFMVVANLGKTTSWRRIYTDKPELAHVISDAIRIAFRYSPGFKLAFSPFSELRRWVGASEDEQVINEFFRKVIGWVKLYGNAEAMKDLQRLISYMFVDAAREGCVVALKTTMALPSTFPDTITKTDLDYEEAFIQACETGQIEVIRLFLRRPETSPPFGSPDISVSEHSNLLAISAKSKNVALFDLLWANFPSFHGKVNTSSAMHHAATSGCVEMVQRLQQLQPFIDAGWSTVESGSPLQIPEGAEGVINAAARSDSPDALRALITPLLDIRRQPSHDAAENIFVQSATLMMGFGYVEMLRVMIETQAISKLQAAEILKQMFTRPAITLAERDARRLMEVYANEQ